MTEEEILALIEEVEDSCIEAAQENPDVSEDQVFWEVSNNLLHGYPPEVYKRVRGHLGF